MVKAKKAANHEHAWYVLAVARVLLGFMFFWAFLDKTMGLGFATPSAHSWLNGGSPTAGFLAHVQGPWADFFQGMSGNLLIDWLFMLGLLGIGMALILGVGVRLAAVMGTMMLALMWLASMPMVNNPFIDEHIIYAVMLWVFALAPRKWSLVDQWLETPTVKKNPWLW